MCTCTTSSNEITIQSDAGKTIGVTVSKDGEQIDLGSATVQMIIKSDVNSSDIIATYTGVKVAGSVAEYTISILGDSLDNGIYIYQVQIVDGTTITPAYSGSLRSKTTI